MKYQKCKKDIKVYSVLNLKQYESQKISYHTSYIRTTYILNHNNTYKHLGL